MCPYLKILDSWVILANLGAIGTVFHVIAVAAYDRYDLASVFQKFDPSGQETEQYSLWLLVRRSSVGHSSICLLAFFLTTIVDTQESPFHFNSLEILHISDRNRCCWILWTTIVCSHLQGGISCSW